ncbi:MAG: late competence development ComFB family protein [Candidatus Schekmanbacteria bacterium]|nr:late competence development ComFB family protein [Candidatus Schekmanbacteria bacterium]
MNFFDENDLEILRNANEERVLDDVELVLRERTDLCPCRDCRLDMVALALNNLPARYRISAGHGIHRTDISFSQVRAAVIKACAIVKRYPHHR